MARLSIIIPANRNASALEDTLVSVLTHRPDDCEILVAHAGTYDDPYGVGDEVRLLDCAGAGLGELISAAIEGAHGEFVHLLMPGCNVVDGWSDAALSAFVRDEVGCASPLLTAGESQEYVIGVASGFGGRSEIAARDVTAAERKAPRVVGPTSHAAFYRKSALESIGGWPVAFVSDLADIDVALSLREAGWETAVAHDCEISRQAKAVPNAGAFRRAIEQERLFWRHTSSAAGRTMRPAVAALQCAATGWPWSIALAGIGKVLARGEKTEGARHQEILAAAAQRTESHCRETDAGDRRIDPRELPKAA